MSSTIGDFYSPVADQSEDIRYSIPLDGIPFSLGPFPFRPKSIVLVNQTGGNLLVNDDRGEQYEAASNVAATYGVSETVRLQAFLDKPQTSGKASVIVSPASAGISASQLASLGAIGGGTKQLAYNELTTNLNSTATTEATAAIVVTAGAVTVDGVTPIVVEFGCEEAQNPTSGGLLFVLYEDGVSIGQIGRGRSSASLGTPYRLERQFTPTAGSHTYSVRLYVVSGTGTVNAGLGGVGNLTPAFIRVREVT